MATGTTTFAVLTRVVVVIGSLKVVSEGGAIVEARVRTRTRAGTFRSRHVRPRAYETSGYSKAERGGESSESSESSESCATY
jgi:hypothetical protein